MYTNMENLCGSCHTQGKYRYTGRGKTKGGSGPVNLSSTHNNNIMAQYRTSGHADKTGQPFGNSLFLAVHQLFYPNDMSITGNGGIGTRRNRGNTDFTLTPATTATNEYLSASGNTTLPGLAGTTPAFSATMGWRRSTTSSIGLGPQMPRLCGEILQSHALPVMIHTRMEREATSGSPRAFPLTPRLRVVPPTG